jgi:hypothetical protein
MFNKLIRRKLEGIQSEILCHYFQRLINNDIENNNNKDNGNNTNTTNTNNNSNNNMNKRRLIFKKTVQPTI